MEMANRLYAITGPDRNQTLRSGERLKLLYDTINKDLSAACLDRYSLQEQAAALREFVWNYIYANNDKINVWHLKQMSEYILDQLHDLRHAAWSTVVLGNVRWRRPATKAGLAINNA